MAITKAKLILLISDYTGDIELAAKRLGVSPKTISNWVTDERGRIVSRSIKDAAMAALMREYLRGMKAGKLKPDAPSNVAMKDLVDLAGL